MTGGRLGKVEGGALDGRQSTKLLFTFHRTLAKPRPLHACLARMVDSSLAGGSGGFQGSFREVYCAPTLSLLSNTDKLAGWPWRAAKQGVASPDDCTLGQPKEGALVGSLSLSSWPTPEWCQNGWQQFSGSFRGVSRRGSSRPRTLQQVGREAWVEMGPSCTLFYCAHCVRHVDPILYHWLQTDLKLTLGSLWANVSLSPGFSPTFIPPQTILPNSPEKQEEACQGRGQSLVPQMPLAPPGWPWRAAKQGVASPTQPFSPSKLTYFWG